MAMWNSGGSYATWASYLERWGAGETPDASRLPALLPDDFAPDAWERLTSRLVAALAARLQLWARALSAAIAEARDEFGIARALTQARAGLVAIRSLGMQPGLPSDLGRRLLDIIDTQIRMAQQSLEDQISHLRRSGVSHHDIETRLRIVRDNPLTTTSACPATTIPTDNWATTGVPGSRRRVVID